MDDIQRADIRDLLNNTLRDNPTWRDLAEAIAQVFNTNVEDPIDQLAKLRWIRRDTDPKVLEQAARMLGFDLTQDVLYLNAENLTKIVTQLPHYPDHNSTRYFTNFIDMILNAMTDVRYLYTKDYINFVEKNKAGRLVIDNGEWFLTTHIELNLALLHFDTLLLADGESMFSRIRDLFFSFSPITLVIERFYFTIVFDDKDWVGGHAFGIGAAFQPGDIEVDIE